MNVKLTWATPDADAIVAYIARVSNPDNQANPTIEGLFRYMMREGHVSPFEMANVCVEITTTRDIARQILRHRSFSFQEFSQRYASTDVLPSAPLRECRLQDPKNRQNSISGVSEAHEAEWLQDQQQVLDVAVANYTNALKRGVAKEVARALLPEGLTTSRLYMQGNFRSWIHYLQSRLHPSTQKEHRLIAGEIRALLRTAAPVLMGAFFPVES